MKYLYIIKTGSTYPSIREKLGDFEQWTLSALDPGELPVRVLDVEKNPELPAAEECRGLVITGSHAMVTDSLPWSRKLEKWIPDLVDKSIPILAVCYGHQLLARAMGGKVDYHPGGIESGTKELFLHGPTSKDFLLADAPAGFKAHTDHSQTVVGLPKGAVSLAHSAHESHHVFRIGNRAWGVQFHPEFTAEIMELYILEQENRLRLAGLDPEKLLDEVRETPGAMQIARRFAGFVRQISIP